MSETKYTPGPWAVEDPIDGQLQIVEASKETCDWRFVATLLVDEDFTFEEHHANARLIAAAPELLEALKEARRYVERAYECAFPDAARE